MLLQVFFRSSTYFHRHSLIFKTTNPNNIFLLPNPLAILNKSRPSWHESMKLLLPPILTFITLSLNLSSPTTFPINQLATITPTVFCIASPTPKNFKTISIHFSPLPFPPHFLQTVNINTTSFQSLRYFSRYPDIDPTLYVKNQIPDCSWGDFPIIRARVHLIFFRGSVLSF